MCPFKTRRLGSLLHLVYKTAEIKSAWRTDLGLMQTVGSKQLHARKQAVILVQVLGGYWPIVGLNTGYLILTSFDWQQLLAECAHAKYCTHTQWHLATRNKNSSGQYFGCNSSNRTVFMSECFCYCWQSSAGDAKVTLISAPLGFTAIQMWNSQK